jgi:hypothetical protein
LSKYDRKNEVVCVSNLNEKKGHSNRNFSFIFFSRKAWNFGQIERTLKLNISKAKIDAKLLQVHF